MPAFGSKLNILLFAVIYLYITDYDIFETKNALVGTAK